MKCAILLLLVIAAACVAGSLIPQGKETIYYMTNYTESVAKVILFLGLQDIFHCWWFVGLTLFLCANLLFCNVLRFPALRKRYKTGFSLEACLKAWDRVPVAKIQGDPEKFFARMGFRNVEKKTDADGRPCLYAVKNKAGIWGAWLCHLGMLIVIAGFGLGQVFQTQYTVYGVPGQQKPFGEEGYELRIDDFSVELRDDATVDQYTSSLTLVKPATGEEWSGETMVNAPLSMKGMKFYQNSTGWAATLEVYKGEEKLQESLLCAGEFARVEGMEDLAVSLTAFYPDYAQGEDGPLTLSPALKNPGYLYTLYYRDQVLGMNVLTGDQVISVEDYVFSFRDPKPYTLIQIKEDPFRFLAALGGILVMISLILAFYIRPAELWAFSCEEGGWDFAGRSKKGGTMFLEEIREEARKENEENGK